MFEIVETFLVQFVNLLPFLIVFILVMNLVAYLLWGGR